MSIRARITAPDHQTLSPDAIQQTLADGLQGNYTNDRVLVLIPDHTRTIPLPMLFRALVDILHDTKALDFMVALGTHPPLSQKQLCDLVGITPIEHDTIYSRVAIVNHAWEHPDTLVQIGTLEQAQIQAIAGDNWHPSLGSDVPVRINRAVMDYDHILILGPTFPHEVVGFSGGAKYLFPGISGKEMIDVSHWLGALAGVIDTIGVQDTPVRAMIHAAADYVSTPITLASMVVVGDSLAGLFIGDYISAWQAAADLSSQRHIQWLDQPMQRVLSRAPAMYDELWTAAKAMYKLEPAIADGGEVIIYAPHLDTVSEVHGEGIYEAGYHVLDYYLKQWDKFKHLPLGVLAHGTHLKGAGTYDNGTEKPRINVTLASQIPPDDCEKLNLGYMNPAEIEPADWQGRTAEGIHYIPKAGETLYRVRPDSQLASPVSMRIDS